MKTRRILFAALVVLAFAAPALAAAAADPVKITGDTFVIDDANRVATFSGSVVVTRTKLTVWAPKVVVDYGEGGPTSIKSFVASGGVRIKTPDQDATGDRAEYDPTTQRLRLTGHVMVVSGNGTVGSPDLLIDLKTSTSVFSGGAKGRVTGVFTPK